ncbi:MAG TPA: phosphate ABC transporter ATP-binding protein, partial [Candidatus Nanopelagicales bacterium]
MAKRIDVKDLDIYYGDFKAVEGVTMTVEPRS